MPEVSLKKESLSSSSTSVAVKKADKSETAKSTFKHANLNEYLAGYYQFIFPHNLFHQWLSYGNVKKDYFENREFSFCLPGDIYLRFNSFDSQQDMRRAITTRLPVKIDIGAVYNIKPKDSKKVKILNFTPEERELVFDIDMTDYDDVRSCCSGTAICPKCWPFMVVAARILEAFLREDFGFKHLLWVYSGRRGLHCWVADERARKLVGHARDAVANFINIFDGGQFKAKKVEIDGGRGIHPSIARSVHIVDKYFDELMVKNQDFLGNKNQIEMVCNLCQDVELKQELKKYLNDPGMRNSADRWKALSKISQQYYGKQNHQVRKWQIYKHRFFLEEVKLQLCYPRLDINVTKGLNHLLKVPFSVHPKTGKVCVPIDFARLDEFDPFEPAQVPTVDLLCEQLDSLSKDGAGSTEESVENKSVMGSSRLAERTSLAPSLAVFRGFIKAMEQGRQGALLAKSDQKLTF